MATTANYGWTTPDDTDLVKDGASAIRTLGSAIDTTVKANADATGLVHINTTSFSAVASQSINNVFSATYDNYQVVLQMSSSVSVQDLNLRLRVAGTDNSTASSYVEQYLVASGNTASAARSTSNLYRPGTISSTLRDGYTIIFYNPFNTVSTNFASYGSSGYLNSYLDLRVGTHNQTVSYDGFTIYPTSGTITGSISIYGLRKS